MPNLTTAFETSEPVLNIYYTAGFPSLADTVPILLALQAAGADLVEIGIPFSDPVADGETIQKSNAVALANGMSVALLFEQLRAARDLITVPIILMGYFNPVLQFGVERFCQHAAECGVSGLIFPDLPILVYEEEYQTLFKAHGLTNIFLITPQTSEARIRKIDNLSKGFIYMVSAPGVTGSSGSQGPEQVAYFARIQGMKLKTPRLIGFGIATSADFENACRTAHGAIIGSAFIKSLAETGATEADIIAYVHSIRKAPNIV